MRETEQTKNACASPCARFPGAVDPGGAGIQDQASVVIISQFLMFPENRDCGSRLTTDREEAKPIDSGMTSHNARHLGRRRLGGDKTASPDRLDSEPVEKRLNTKIGRQAAPTRSGMEVGYLPRIARTQIDMDGDAVGRGWLVVSRQGL